MLFVMYNHTNEFCNCVTLVIELCSFCKLRKIINKKIRFLALLKTFDFLSFAIYIWWQCCVGHYLNRHEPVWNFTVPVLYISIPNESG